MTVIFGVMFSDQLSSVPVARSLVLVSLSVQVPAAVRPCRLVSVAELRVYSGSNVPVKGAVPVVIELSAESSKTVLTKFVPSCRPRPRTAGSCVPFGAIRTAVRSESAWTRC